MLFWEWLLAGLVVCRFAVGWLTIGVVFCLDCLITLVIFGVFFDLLGVAICWF